MDVASIMHEADEILNTVRPFLQEDGGDITVIDFEIPTRVLLLRWEGNCRQCPLSPLTLRGGIERVLLAHLPEIRRIEVIL
jgi:Fe-S cluster biogenesis protein NfuA